jgi:aminoglycoside 6'-N-acetyltransferase
VTHPTDDFTAWAPIQVKLKSGVLTVRQATPSDTLVLESWDDEPSVIACTTDDPNAAQAFPGAIWGEEIAMASPVSSYFIAELDGRPIGAMQVIDPHLEPTHYWGDCEPNLRAIDIWIGDEADRSRGLGAAMMHAVMARCFADPAVAGIIIDPLASNTRAHFFYQRLGFRPLGRRIFNDEDDCLVHRLDRAEWERRQ